MRISDHGYDELNTDAILIEEVIAGLANAWVVEDYPHAFKGPTVLVLQRDSANRPLHVLWAIPKGLTEPAVLVTAYRPAEEKWSDDFMRRRAKWNDRP